MTVSPNMRVGGCTCAWTVAEVVWACATGAGGGASLGVWILDQRAGEFALKIINLLLVIYLK